MPGQGGVFRAAFVCNVVNPGKHVKAIWLMETGEWWLEMEMIDRNASSGRLPDLGPRTREMTAGGVLHPLSLSYGAHRKLQSRSPNPNPTARRGAEPMRRSCHSGGPCRQLPIFSRVSSIEKRWYPYEKCMCSARLHPHPQCLLLDLAIS
jgi:hypothetical protein